MRGGDLRLGTAARSEHRNGYLRHSGALPARDARVRVGLACAHHADAAGPEASPCPVRLAGLIGGSLLLTARGLRPVETLRRGDLVATLLPRGPFFVPIAWVGCRRASTETTPGRPDCPVLIRRHAIAHNIPANDIVVAPEHAIYIGESLYFPRMLVNGRSIAYQRPADAARQYAGVYWGFGLAVPNLVLAQNLPVESLMPAASAAYSKAAPVPPRNAGPPALHLVKA